MKPPLGSILSVTGALMVLTPVTSSAQDFFRELGTSRSSGGIGPVWPSEYTYRDISPSGLSSLETGGPGDHEPVQNFALGPVHFSIAASAGAEFNDNITLSQDNRQSDIIIRPGLDIEASIQFSELNTLRFSVALSYAKYLDHSKYDTDGLLISPTSELEFGFSLGEVKIKLRERLSYQEDPYDVPQISGVAQYQRWENQAGIKAEYDFNSKVGLSAGYDRYNLWTKQEVFSDQDRSIDTIFIKPYYKVSDAIKVGLNASYSFINFDSNDRADGHSLLVGPYIEWQLSQNTNAYLEGGFQSLEFDGGYTPTRLIDGLELDITPAQRRAIDRESSDNEGSNSWYVRLELDSKISEVFRNRLSASKTAEVGFFSDYFDLYHIEYNAEYTGIKNVSVGPSIFYEYYETSGDAGEKAHRIGAALGIRYYFTNSLTVGLDYRFLWKDSNTDGSDYYQNLVFLSAYYKF